MATGGDLEKKIYKEALQKFGIVRLGNYIVFDIASRQVRKWQKIRVHK